MRPQSENMREMAVEIRRSLAAMPVKNVPSFRILRRAWSKRLKNLPGTSIIALARRLVPLGPWERGAAYEIIEHHQGAQETLRPRDVVVLGRGMDSWGDVDGFACFVAGPAWRQHRIPESLVRSWATSPSCWWRRAALVCTVPLNSHARGGTGDTLRTLRICRMLVHDQEELVVKALSWALRELSKRNPRAVEAFIERYHEVLSPRVKREVRNKLETGVKNPRRAASSSRGMNRKVDLRPPSGATR